MLRLQEETVIVKPTRALPWPEGASADWALAQECAAGSEDACTRLVTDHQRMVYQLGLHLLGDPQEALDLCQEVFLRVFRMLSQFRGQSSLHLDLPHRHQSGIEPPALVAAASQAAAGESG